MNEGLKESSKQLKIGMSDIGEGCINLNPKNQNLIYEIKLYESQGANPIGITLYYNHQNKEITGEYGKGMRISLYKEITEYGGHLMVENSDGSKEIYEEISSQKYKNEEQQIEIEKQITPIDSDSDEISYRITDLYGNIMEVDETSGKYPKKITKINGDTITITSNQINNHRGNKIEIEKEEGMVKRLIGKYNEKEIISIKFTYNTAKELIKIRWNKIVNGTEIKVKEVELENKITELIVKDTIRNEQYSYKMEEDRVIHVEEQGQIIYTLSYAKNKTTVTDRYGNQVAYIFTEKDLIGYEQKKKSFVGYTYTEDRKLSLKTNIFTIGKEKDSLSIAGFQVEDSDEEIEKIPVSSYLAQLGLTNEYRIEQGMRLNYTYTHHMIEGESISLVLFGKTIGQGDLLTIKIGERTAVLKNTKNEYSFMAFGITAEEEIQSIAIEINSQNEISISDILLYDKAYGSMYKYNEKNLLMEEEENGNKKSYEYDAKHFLKKQKIYGVETQLETNEKGQLNRKILSNGSYTAYVYNEMNLPRGIRISTSSSDRIRYEDYEYDNIGNQIEERDGLGKTRYTQYNEDGSIKAILDKNSGKTEYEYNEDGTLAKIKRSNRNVDYSYNEKKQLIGITAPNGTNYSYTYDAKNRITTVKLDGNIVEEYTYTLENDIATIKTNGQTTTYAYDKGRIKSIIKGNESVEINYDEEEETQIKEIIGNTYKTSYSFKNEKIKEISVREKTTQKERSIIRYSYNRYGQRVATERKVEGKSLVETYDSLLRSRQYGGKNTQNRVNQYNIESSILQRFHIVPLNQDVSEIGGIKPIAFNGRTYKDGDAEASFIYNAELKRYTFYANMHTLQYNFKNNENGSIYLRFKNYSLSTEKNLFEFVSKNQTKKIGLYLSTNDMLILQYNSTQYPLNQYVEPNQWHYIALSYEFREEESINSGEDPYLSYKIIVDIDNKTYTKSIDAVAAFSDMSLTLGNNSSLNRGFQGEMELLMVGTEAMTANQMEELRNINITTYGNEYDELGLLTNKSITTAYGSIYNTDIEYKNDGIKVSAIPKKETISYKSNCHERNYETDNNGNVTAITDNIFGNHTYEYNESGYLIKEDDIEYEYDGNGNITRIGERTFEYDSRIKDRLIKVGGKSIEYNGLMPISYNGMKFIYNKNTLAQIENQVDSETQDTIRYEYDETGLRIKKTIEREYTDDRNGYTKEYSYYYEGEQLVSEITTDYRLDFLYDENKRLYGFKYNERDNYYYIRDILGSILGIVDISGKLVVKYDYDGYATYQNITGDLASTIGEYNPFRYKGYYYDKETQLFYCSFRYYNPKWGRWLQPDSIEYLDPESINGLNLYAYCGNDPINKYDPTGHFAISLTMLGLIIGAAIGATAGGIAAYNIAKNNGAEGWELFGWTMAGIVGGGVIGGALGAGVGALVTKATGVIGLSITKYSIIPIKGTTVLGHMPGYIGAAQATGSGYYLVSNGTYDKMVQKGVEWTNNMTYLKDANSLGSRFVLAPDFVVREGGTFWKEIQYLIENGIPWEMF